MDTLCTDKYTGFQQIPSWTTCVKLKQICINKTLAKLTTSMGAWTPVRPNKPSVSADQLRKKNHSLFLLPPGHTPDICGDSLVSCTHASASLPPFLFSADKVSRDRRARWWLCRAPCKHRLGSANISPRCLHGNIRPSQTQRAVRLSKCAPTHNAGVYWCCHGSTVWTPTQVGWYSKSKTTELNVGKQHQNFFWTINGWRISCFNVQLCADGALLQETSDP